MRRHLSLLTAGLALCASAAPLHADVPPITFANSAELPAAGRLAAIGELDGNPGLEVAGFEGASVKITPNLGGRSFAAAIAIGFAATVQGLKLLDVDHDGRLDLATLRSTPPAIVVRRNLGGLSFADAVETSIPGNPQGLTTGDLDADGWPDLVAVCRDSIDALRTTPGGFVSTRSPIGGGSLWEVLGDVDGDNTSDLVRFTGTYPNYVLEWRHGIGDGGFGAAVTLSVSNLAGQVLVSDLDGDGLNDIVLSNDDRVFWHRASTPGNFESPVPLALPRRSGLPPQIAVADFDGHGGPDLIGTVNGIALRGVQVLRDAASPAHHLMEWHVGSSPYVLLAADLDNDGHLDVATGGGTTVVLWNDGQGRLLGKLHVSLELGDGSGGPYGLLTSRSAPSTPPDLIAALRGPIRLVRNAGNGTFFAPESVGFGGILATADLDHDGDDDLVATGVDSAWVLPRLGGGGFGPAGPVYVGLRPLGLADFSGDGIPDLGLVDAASGLWVRASDGAGGFGEVAATGATMAGFRAAWFGDLDGDGFADAAWAEGPATPEGDYPYQTLNAAVRVARNDGVGHLIPFDVDTLEYQTNTHGYSYSPGSIRSGDVDGDGDPDLVLMNTGAAYLGWWGALLNNGDGSMTVAGPARFGGNPGGVLEVADMNGDGMDDVLIHESDGLDTDFHALASLGAGLFGPWEYLVGDESVLGMVAEDLDGDGRRDVALLSSYHRRLAILRNVSTDLPTAALVSCVRSGVIDGGVEIEWFSPDGDAFASTVERAVSSDSWSAIGRVDAVAGLVHWRDTTVRPGGRYGYRLRYDDDGVSRVTSETWIDFPIGASALAIRVVGPNPSPSLPSFELGMPRAGEATIEIFDLGGRRIAARWVRSAQGGFERVAFANIRLAPGLHLARARSGSSEAITRFVIVR